MAYGDASRTRDRIKAGIGVALICLLVGSGLLYGIRPDIAQRVENSFDLIALDAEPPPPPPQPPPPEARPEKSAPKNPEGAASPENLKSKATQTTAPKPKIVTPPKNPVPAAEKPGTGNDATQGASDRPGPGTGAGGIGTGTGSGMSGSGDGGGGSGGGVLTPARKIAGTIRIKDFPKNRRDARNGKSVGVRFTVQPNGRVTGCRIIRTSGSGEDDAITCRLIEERFRYEPARNAAGTPVASQQQWFQKWWLEPRD